MFVVADVDDRGILGEAEIQPLVCEYIRGVCGVVVVAGNQLADIRQVFKVVDNDDVVQGQRTAWGLVNNADPRMLSV